MGLTFDSICKNNGLIIFDALSSEEMQTGLRLYSDVLDHTSSIGRDGYVTRLKVSSLNSLHAHLEAILTECRSGVLLPILHFEGHGDREHGFQIGLSGEFISWQSLQKWIGRINAVTRNNTGVVVAACHGLSLSTGLQINAAAPFNFFLAPHAEMSAGAFWDTMSSFYKEVASTGDLASGLRALPSDMQLVVAGEWFYSHLGSYLVHHHTQKSRQEIVEACVSRELESQPPVNRAHRRARLKQVREAAKKHVAAHGFGPVFANIFFHGHPPVDWKQMSQHVCEEKKLKG